MKGVAPSAFGTLSLKPGLSRGFRSVSNPRKNERNRIFAPASACRRAVPAWGPGSRNCPSNRRASRKSSDTPPGSPRASDRTSNGYDRTVARDAQSCSSSGPGTIVPESALGAGRTSPSALIIPPSLMLPGPCRRLPWGGEGSRAPRRISARR
jgi:hypothetical protein